MVERVVWGDHVGGSNPFTRTKPKGNIMIPKQTEYSVAKIKETDEASKRFNDALNAFVDRIVHSINKTKEYKASLRFFEFNKRLYASARLKSLEHMIIGLKTADGSILIRNLKEIARHDHNVELDDNMPANVFDGQSLVWAWDTVVEQAYEVDRTMAAK